MKLFELVGCDKDNGFSPFVWRTKLALAHKGLEAELVPLHFSEIRNTLAAIYTVLRGNRFCWTGIYTSCTTATMVCNRMVIIQF